MSTTTSIGATNYTSLEGGFNGSGVFQAGTYTALPPFGEAPRAGKIEKETILVTFTGVDNVGRKLCGKRGLNIWIDFVLAASTKAALQTAIETLQNSVVDGTRVTITLPNATAINGCVFVRGTGQPKRFFPMGTLFCCTLTIEARSLSDSN